MSYTFRIRFDIPAEYEFAFPESPESEIALSVGGPVLSRRKSAIPNVSQHLVIKRGGYETEEDARLNGNRWCDAILIAGLRMRRFFNLGRFRYNPHVVVCEAGLRKIEEKKGIPYRNDIVGLDVYEDKGHRFALGMMTPKVSRDASKLVDALIESYSENPLPTGLRIALELYGLSRFARSESFTLLTAVGAIEALAGPPLCKSDEIRSAITDLIHRLPSPLSDDETFIKGLHRLKRESIGQACRRLIVDYLGEDDAKLFSKIYKIRGNLLHKGIAKNEDISQATHRVDELLHRLLVEVVNQDHSHRGRAATGGVKS